MGSLSRQAACSGYLNSEAILGNKIWLRTGLLAGQLKLITHFFYMRMAALSAQGALA